MKNILFITWDGPQTSYMEGLFMPILSEIQKKTNYNFHIIQFTWGTTQRIKITQKKAQDLNLTYSFHKIFRKPIATLGSIATLIKGIHYIEQYIKKHKIDVVMPRSTMPAIMANRLKNKNIKILFDADGLAIEERVDFSGLSKTSFTYNFFTQEEQKIINKSHGVITRSQKAIDYHIQNNPNLSRQKFDVVVNGRDVSFFNFNESYRDEVQKKLHFTNKNKVIVYCGSLGGQYCWGEMVEIFSKCFKVDDSYRFLVLTGNIEYVADKVPEAIKPFIVVKKVPFEEIPKYLSVANFAFALREPKPSMKAIAPIKLGEYLLMGIPTIASSGIGDTQNILQEFPNCHLFNHTDVHKIEKAVTFVTETSQVSKQQIREKAVLYFSLEKSAESYITALNKI